MKLTITLTTALVVAVQGVNLTTQQEQEGQASDYNAQCMAEGYDCVKFNAKSGSCKKCCSEAGFCYKPYQAQKNDYKGNDLDTDSELVAEAIRSTKLGFTCANCPDANYQALTPAAGWTYNYRMYTRSDFFVTWAQQNDVEFVPMINNEQVQFADGSKCSIAAGECSVSKIVDELNNTKAQVKAEYLMGFNEQYSKSDTKHWKWIEPSDAAKYWAQIFQPVAEQTGLKLVSMTTKVENKGLHWMTDFLKACWALKDDATYPCDVWTIKVFSVHEYKCSEWWWRDNFSGPESTFQKSMVNRLGADEGIDWADYVNSRKIWVTETNCNADGDLPSNSESCKRITGQVPEYGKGSVQTAMELLPIERVAQWNGYHANTDGRDKDANARLSDEHAELQPLGRAWANNFSPTLSNC